LVAGASVLFDSNAIRDEIVEVLASMTTRVESAIV
jgi:hypothetical protein